MIKQILITAIVLLHSLVALAQDDLLADLEAEQADERSFVEATFKGTRLINGHSVETRKEGVMDFIIAHRFGTVDRGIYDLFGLDNASIRIGLEYAVNDRLYVGIGRSSFEKTYDSFLKYRLIRQSKGGRNVPFSVTWLSSMALKTFKEPALELSLTDQMAYSHTLLIASKINSSISIQLMPTYVHRNLIREDDLNNDVYALGVGGRVKLTQRMALCIEYYHQFQKLNESTENALAIGIDIETGGHVFQLQFTNATSMIPKGFVSETTNDFFAGEIHFGFNVSRTFQLK